MSARRVSRRAHSLRTHSSVDSPVSVLARLLWSSSGRAHSCFRASLCVTAILHSNCVFPLLSPRLGWSRMRHEDTIPRTLRVRIAVTGLETSQTAETKDYGHPRHERDGLFWPGQPSSRRAVAHLQGGMAAVSARRHAYRAIDSWRRRRADADRTSPASHGGIVLAEPSHSVHRDRRASLARRVRIRSSALARPAPVLYINSYVFARLDRVTISRAHIIHFNAGAH